ncbi:MAG: lipoyl synthase [Oscillospiraceae bacterium]|jgi:lipoic acid synthetase|nr:lipoyl synthase [Oscillospiraceae bacterium]
MQRKPSWLRVEYSAAEARKTQDILEKLRLNTVCNAADCPNLSECFRKGTATFMIMGSQCTRNCRFCKVTHGEPSPLDPDEPARVAEAVAALKLSHAVVTSVTRDDLPDGGAAHFAKVIEEVRKTSPDATVEVLIPDMKGDTASLDIVLRAKPDVLNHNIETVPSLYSRIRPEADYRRSLFVLEYCAGKGALTKTGMMVGLGETEEEVFRTMEDILAVGCGLLTVGQYLRPSKQHPEVVEYVTPEQFERYRIMGEQKGFRYVASAPLVRSSYRAGEALGRL